MNERDNSWLWIVVTVLGFLLFQGSDDPVVPDDPPRNARLVEGIRKLAAAHPEQARKIAPFYQAAARIAQREEVGTSHALLSALETAIRIKGGLNPDLALPGLSRERNALLEQVLGQRDGKLDADKRKELVEVLQAISWSLRNSE